MDDLKKQVADRLKQATNILVTVKTDPSIDLLAACLGLSLVLDKIGKHATAVFSGEVPSAIEFLKPEETLEETPNSLRDFIISLDKSKADKLRYKVEDKVVRIFITPFKAGLSQDDLEFSQGDFNIDLLVALGVHEQSELDNAVTAHGRILHDATIISINNTPNGNVGTINWVGTSVSSVSEMVADLAKTLDASVFDEQIATALLTGIVAETSRFSNDKTSPQTMQLAGELMAAGANQQLVATELQSSISVGAPGSVKAEVKPADDNGTLEIKHEAEGLASEPAAKPAEEPAKIEAKPEPKPEPEVAPKPAEPVTSIQPNSRAILPMPDPAHAGDSPVSDVADTPFNGNAGDEDHANNSPAYLIDKASDVANGATGTSVVKPPIVDLPTVPHMVMPPSDGQLPASTTPSSANDAVASGSSSAATDQTLASIEASVGSPHASEDAGKKEDMNAAGVARLDDARQQVLDALKEGAQPLEPLAALGASVPTQVSHTDLTSVSPAAVTPPADDGPAEPVAIEVDTEGNMTTLESLSPPTQTPPAGDVPLPQVAVSAPAAPDPNAPPPVPPPMNLPFAS